MSDESRERSLPPLPRRRALKILGAAIGSATVAGWGGLAGLSGCARRAADEAGDGQAAAEAVRMPLDRLAVGERLTLQVGGSPVELTRSADGVTARSLRCTHFGCTVAWQPERQAYVCPCHDGAYAADGHVIYGPPPTPLPTLPVTVEDGVILVRPLPHKPPGSSSPGRSGRSDPSGGEAGAGGRTT